ncbi:MAG: hypothetical protein K2G51_02365 [Lachnospiraceae bacterium]|nr:hypothetical protein [Lachnospiraceae bacterium]MDE7275126.1 hypothetical protein [Lachnospiraceae bacterium]
MKAGSMEGLIGASLNMKLTRTPMRVFKEAERKGDTEVMKRAMGYVTEFQEKAHECSDRAQEELAKELKEERKEQEIRREQAQERKEETKKYVEKIQENNKADTPKTDSVEISEEGKIVLKSDFQTEDTAPNAEKTDVKMYTDEGKAKALDSVKEDESQKIDITV